MPTRKKENKKNAPQKVRDSAIVPPKEEASKRKVSMTKTGAKEVPRITGLITAGKKKKPK